MTDSDNTTTLLTVTGLTSPVERVITDSSRNALACSNFERGHPADPALTVWQRWQDAHEQTEGLCRQQQRLERKLAETIGYPRAAILLSKDDNVVPLGVVHQPRQDNADGDLGYLAMLQAEREAADRAADLLEMLSQTPAASLAGVAAKLDAVLTEGQPSEDDHEFPWPQIRSALEDIIRIAQLRGPSTQA